jgi:hypothetical protein
MLPSKKTLMWIKQFKSDMCCSSNKFPRRYSPIVDNGVVVDAVAGNPRRDRPAGKRLVLQGNYRLAIIEAMAPRAVPAPDVAMMTFPVVRPDLSSRSFF